MSTKYEKKLEVINELLQKLSRKAESGIPIMVEGRKDFSALRKLGIYGNIICVRNVGKVLADSLDAVVCEEVILLVDFDDFGISLAKGITQYLEGRGVKVNLVFWKEIRALIKRDVKDIEGLPSYLEKLKKHAEP